MCTHHVCPWYAFDNFISTLKLVVLVSIIPAAFVVAMYRLSQGSEHVFVTMVRHWPLLHHSVSDFIMMKGGGMYGMSTQLYDGAIGFPISCFGVEIQANKRVHLQLFSGFMVCL